MEKENTKLKRIRYSWLQRIPVSEFITLAGEYCYLIDYVLGDSDYLRQAKEKLFESVAAIKKTQPLVIYHESTEAINDLNDRRKKKISRIKAMVKAELYDGGKSDLESQIKVAHYWILGIGKRHYDMGFQKLSARIGVIKYWYEDSELIREAIKMLDLTKDVEELFDIDDEVKALWNKRNNDILKRQEKYLRKDLRPVVYNDLALFFKILNDTYPVSPEPELHLWLHRMIYKNLNRRRAFYLRRETMRKKRVAKEKAEKDNKAGLGLGSTKY